MRGGDVVHVHPEALVVDRAEQALRLGVALRGREAEERARLLEVARQRLPEEVHHAAVGLRTRVALLGGAGEPGRGLGVRALASQAVVVAQAQVVLRGGVAGFRGSQGRRP